MYINNQVTLIPETEEVSDFVWHFDPYLYFDKKHETCGNRVDILALALFLGCFHSQINMMYAELPLHILSLCLNDERFFPEILPRGRKYKYVSDKRNSVMIVREKIRIKRKLNLTLDLLLVIIHMIVLFVIINNIKMFSLSYQCTMIKIHICIIMFS